MSSTPLSGIRVLDCSILGPGALCMHLADLGAEVIKVEAPGGDPLRGTTWPIIEGASLMHLHINRSKKSIGIDLRTDDGVDLFEALARTADAVIEGMRPGALQRLGVGYDRLKSINRQIVFCSISGFGSTGPYRRIPTHGVAFDAWAGLVPPVKDDAGRWSIPEHPSVGIHAGPLFGALGVTAAILEARTTGEGSFLEIAQSDAAAAMDWLRSETWMNYRDQDPPTSGVAADRRAPGTAGMADSVRYQFYETKDRRHILFMASERRFWQNFCIGTERPDLYERFPGAERGDHGSANNELRDELESIFALRTSCDWIEFAAVHDTAIVPANTPENLPSDAQFQDRFALLSSDDLGCAQLPTPLRFRGERAPSPTMAPMAGEHTIEVLQDVLGLDSDEIQRLHKSEAIFESS